MARTAFNPPKIAKGVHRKQNGPYDQDSRSTAVNDPPKMTAAKHMTPAKAKRFFRAKTLFRLNISPSFAVILAFQKLDAR
jgi:hypothetical protein